MLSVKPNPSRFVTVLFTLLIAAAFTLHLQAQDTPKAAFVDDWSHHHMIFSNPGTKADAAREGRLEKWQKLTSDPRFHLQQIKRGMGPRPVLNDFDAGTSWGWQPHWAHHDRHHTKPSTDGIVKDWNEVLGGGVSAVSTVAAPVPGTNITGGTSKVTIDAQAFTASAPVAEKETLTFDNTFPYTVPANGSSVTVGTTAYNFATGNITTAPATGCSVYVGNGFTTSGAQIATNLNDAYSLTGTAGNTSYRCAVGVVANTAATLSVATNVVTLTAPAAGTTGFTFSTTGTTNITLANTAGTNGTQDGNNFQYWSGAAVVSAAQLAINIAASVNANATTTTVIQATPNVPNSGQITFTRLLSGTPAGSLTDTIATFSGFTGTWTLTGGTTVQATVQPNVFPAKYGASLTAASCANDFVVYPTGQAGSTSAATIVAYNNIYVGAGNCETTDPTVYWAYNTHTGYSVTTSPILTADGTQVAFVESNGTSAELVILKWAASPTSSFEAPVAATSSGTGAAYRSCVPTSSTPCEYIIAFGNGKDDSISAPFYNYGGTGGYDDDLFVGDDSGNLHRFNGVFLGSPSENTTAPWPVNLSATAELSSPVYDPVSGYVFVGDTGGTLHSVLASTGVAHGSAVIATDSIADAPIVDSTASTVYAFVNRSATVFPNFNAVWQLTTGFTTASSPSPGVQAISQVASAANGFYVYSGTFDNVYFNSSNGVSPTGSLWVLGNTDASTGTNHGTYLYRIPITTGSLGTPVAAVANISLNTAGVEGWGSPITEFFNAGTSIDYIFFSLNRATPAGCSTTAGIGCILSYNVTTPATPTLSGVQQLPTPGTNGCWATGGIVLDNDAAVASGASQIYFIGLNGAAAGGPNGQTSAGCTASAAQTINAIQAAQNNP